MSDRRDTHNIKPLHLHNKEEVAWKDFCEDLLTAHEHIRPGTPDFDAVEEAKGKGHIPGKGQLPQVVMSWQPGQK